MFIAGFTNYFDLYSENGSIKLKTIEEMKTISSPQIWNTSTIGVTDIPINSIKIQNAVYYTIYGEKVNDSDYESVTPENEFDEDTILRATFNNNLSAGSFSFSSGTVLGINVKRRSNNDYQLIYTYQTAYDEDGNETYAFSFEDNTVRLGETYTYAMFPIIQDEDGNIYEQDYTPDNDSAQSFSVDYLGLIISDGEQSYSTFINADVIQSREKPSSVQIVAGKRYPYVISSGDVNYSTGTAQGVFAPVSDCVMDTKEARQYREDFYDFLYNGKPKLLRFYDGGMWLVKVSGTSITEGHDEHPDLVLTSFEWTEIDDCDDLDILSKYGIVNTQSSLDSITQQNTEGYYV